MAWFFSDDNDDDDIFSGSFSLGDLIGSIFGGSLFGSLFGEPEEELPEPSPYAHLPEKERDFLEKINIVLGDNPNQINPESHEYEAHKMKLYFELEDDMLFDGLTEYELGVKHYERECFCHTHKLCTKCYEKLDNGICEYCS